METNTFLTGIDQIGTFQENLRYQRVALLTTGSALNRWMIPTLQGINDRLHLTALFGVEYGIMGERPQGERFESYTDVWTGLPVFSLYRYGAVHLSREMLASFDVLLIDMPLSGTRYCSFIPALHRLLRELGQAGKKLLILDRPNPLGGVKVEGALLSAGLMTDEDDFRLPARFGLTLGELALMMNGEDKLGCEIEIVKAKGWSRNSEHPETGRPWIVSQQHLPRFESCLLSVGLELMSGTNLSYGIGTPLPYEMMGAPYLDAIQLSAVLNKKSLPGLMFNPIYFTPSAGAHQGNRCQGVQIHVVDRKKVQPLRLALELIYEVVREAGQDFRFIEEGKGKYPIDHLFGSNRLRRQPEDYAVILEDCKKEAASFSARREPYLLYE